MATTYLGNQAVIEPQPGGESKERSDLGYQITTYVTPDTNSISTSFVEIEGTWSLHSDKKPLWVESNNKALAGLLAEAFGCPIGRPDNWYNGIQTDQEVLED